MDIFQAILQLFYGYVALIIAWTLIDHAFKRLQSLVKSWMKVERLRRVDDNIIVVKEVHRLSDTHRMIKDWI